MDVGQFETQEVSVKNSELDVSFTVHCTLILIEYVICTTQGSPNRNLSSKRWWQASILGGGTSQSMYYIWNPKISLISCSKQSIWGYWWVTFKCVVLLTMSRAAYIVESVLRLKAFGPREAAIGNRIFLEQDSVEVMGLGDSEYSALGTQKWGMRDVNAKGSWKMLARCIL